MDQPFEKAIQGIRDEILRRSEIVEPWHSYWYYRPLRNFPPKTVQFPSEYDGGERLSLACTQTDLPDRKQRELIREWCELLPTLPEVRILWFQSKVTQELFESACAIEKLEGLYIKWSNIKNLEPIKDLAKLTHLHIGGAPSAVPIEALCHLQNLVDLELHNVRSAGNIAFLKQMPQLQALDMAGSGNSLKSLRIESLDPLRSLVNLEKLGISTATITDESLEPIADLPCLKYLLLSNQFKMEEIAKLAGKLPAVEGACFAPIGEPVEGIRCKKCGGSTMVPLTGKRKPWLCLACDAARIERHITEFKRIKQEAAEGAS